MYLKSKPLQFIHLGYNQNGKADVISPGSGKQLHLYNAKIQNRTGGAIDMGILKKLDTASWKFYTIVAASTPDATEVTTTIQAGSNVTIFTTTNNDGYLVSANKRFNLIGLNLGTASSGGSPVYTYEYYNGSAYTTLTTNAVPVYTSTGTVIVLFNAPQDWAVGTTAAVGGDSSNYNILVRATTASSSVGAVANAMWVGQFLDFEEGIADNGKLELNMSISRPLILDGNEAVFPYFGGTANALNTMRVMYSIQD